MIELKLILKKELPYLLQNKLLLENSRQAIVAINNLIIFEHLKSKLKTIADKIPQSVKLSQRGSVFWDSFFNCEISYIFKED
jgi:hypothetical protein